MPEFSLNAAEIRSLPILLSYLCLAASLALYNCRNIYYRYQARKRQADWLAPQRRRQFLVFAALAALSLGTTWYFMFAFFAHSYGNWEAGYRIAEATAPPQSFVLRLELWLQRSRLFREAWETVVETPARFWWSGQIFLWTTAWSLFLGLMARRYGIPHVWTYMLLGQVVAISVAQNLFFATILGSAGPLSTPEATKGREWMPSLLWEVLPITLSLLSSALVPSAAHTPYFMLTLLTPHLLLFVPTILRPNRSFGHCGADIATAGPSRADPTGAPKNAGEESATWRYTTIFQWLLLGYVLALARFTFLVLEDVKQTDTGITSLARSLFRAAFEHPAASSVSADVVFCVIGAVAWAAVHGGDRNLMLGGTKTVEHLGTKHE